MKKLFKSAVAVLLACILLIPGGFVFAAEPVTFTDVKSSDWFAPYVDYCSANGLVNGMTPTKFAPNQGLTRAMFVTILYRFAEVEAAEGAVMPFTDVTEGYWGRDAILWAYENEIVNGMTPTTFAPDSKITREQMCTILCRFASAMGYEMPGAESGIIFEDDYMISDWAYDAVYTCANAGIVNGITPSSFGPVQTATRAQACTILMRFIRYTTTTYTEVDAGDGKTVFEYSDKYGVYAGGYEVVDGDGNYLEYYYEEGEYREKIENTYADGIITKSEYTDSEGYGYTETYTYDENGNLTEHKFADTDGYEATDTLTYNENGDLIERKFITSDGYEETEICTYDENGYLTERKYVDTDGYESTESYTYNEDLSIAKYVFTDSEEYERTVVYTYDDGKPSRVHSSDTTGSVTEIRAMYVDGRLRVLDISDDFDWQCMAQDFNENGTVSRFMYEGVDDSWFKINFDENGEFKTGYYYDCELLDGEYMFITYADSYDGPNGLPTKYKVSDPWDPWAEPSDVTVDYENETLTLTDKNGSVTDSLENEWALNMLTYAVIVKGIADSFVELDETDVWDTINMYIQY